MLRTLIVGLSLVLIAGSMSASTWSDPEIRAWVAELESPDLVHDRRELILQGLESAAVGRPIDPRPAEALFALARFQPEDRPLGPQIGANILSRMATLYADDPRIAYVLQRLAKNQLAADNRLGAHFTLTRLAALPDGASTPELQIRAAANAVVVGDMQSAIDWSASLDRWDVSADLKNLGWRTRLTAAQALGRHAEAIAALDRLEEAKEKLPAGNPAALLAAARTEAVAGRLNAAEIRYRDFINVHTRSPHRAAAMLEHAELLARLQRTTPALRVLEWLTDEYDGTQEADIARIRGIEWRTDLSPEGRAVAYREIATRASTEQAAVRACNNLLELLIAEGQPLEAISVLAWMTKNTHGFPALAARRGLMRGSEAAIRLLASRDDVVGLAAAAAAIQEVGLAVPAGQAAVVDSALHSIGMIAVDPRLKHVQALADEGRWDEVNRLLAHVDRRPVEDATHTRMTALAAEALWRLGRSDAALSTIGQTLDSRDLPPLMARRLAVLRGDIEFAEGDTSTACRDYRRAAAIRQSAYVADQLLHCDPLVAGSKRGAP